MRDLMRQFVFTAIIGTLIVVAVQALVDIVDINREIRNERRRNQHPSQGNPRYE